MKKRRTSLRGILFAAAFMLFGAVQSTLNVQAAQETTYQGVDYESVFNAEYYGALYPDLQAAFGADKGLLFQHFVTCGMREGRIADPSFNVTFYKQAYPDLQNAFGDQDLSLYYLHYIFCGKAEGRIATGEAPAAAPVTAAPVSTAQRERQVYQILISMKEVFPEGTPLDNDNFWYQWNGGIYTGGFGCAGFAFFLSDAAFGNAPAVMHDDFNNIKVGDILRVNYDTHSVIVLEVHNDYVIVAEGNYNRKVHWGRKITRKSLWETGANIMTRY